jgi:putative ABC transport system permease protein
MPPGFSYPSARAQLWIPMRLDPKNFLEFWGSGFVPLVARLRPGDSFTLARTEVHHLAAEFLKTFPYPMPSDFNRDSTAIPLQEDLVGPVRNKLVILLACVGVVLLIACTNVASLLLSRATVRRKEIALRMTLGAGRLRIIRQLITESVLLAALGGGAGLVLGVSALSVFKSVLPWSTPGLAQAAIDWQVTLSIAALALLSGLVFGIAPALSASQIDLASAVRTGTQRSGGTFWTRVRTALIGAQVALTVLLVVSAGLLIKSLYTLAGSPLGFAASHILTVRISPNQAHCVQRASCVSLYERIVSRASATPGVTAAAIASTIPLDGAQPSLAVDVEGQPKSPGHPAPLLWAGAVSPGYRRLMQIPLLAGRDIAAADSAQAEPVILISAATAKRFWPGENPIGKHIKTTGEEKWRRIVGMVGDVRQFDMGTGFPDFIPGAMYMPYAQAAREDGTIPAAMTLMVNYRADGERIGREIRVLAQDQDPAIPVGRAVALEDVVTGSISDFRSTIRVFISFAAGAMLLAAIGVYGLVSYWVSQRTFEIGIRMAMGATRASIVGMVLGQGLRIAMFGTVAGVIAAFAATRFLGALLFGVSATDPLTFAGVVALVLLVTIAATAMPAWRASRIDPVQSICVE